MCRFVHIWNFCCMLQLPAVPLKTRWLGYLPFCEDLKLNSLRWAAMSSKCLEHLMNLSDFLRVQVGNCLLYIGNFNIQRNVANWELRMRQYLKEGSLQKESYPSLRFKGCQSVGSNLDYLENYQTYILEFSLCCKRMTKCSKWMFWKSLNMNIGVLIGRYSYFNDEEVEFIERKQLD